MCACVCVFVWCDKDLTGPGLTNCHIFTKQIVVNLRRKNHIISFSGEFFMQNLVKKNKVTTN